MSYMYKVLALLDFRKTEEQLDGNLFCAVKAKLIGI